MKSQTIGDTSSLEYMRGRRVFEINPEHPIIKNLNVRWRGNTFFYNLLLDTYNMYITYFSSDLQAASRSNPDDEDALRAIDLLYDTALVSSGYTVSGHAIILCFYCIYRYALGASRS